MSDASPPVPTYESLAGIIEHLVLDPALTDDDVAASCRLAREYGISSVIVRPCDIDNAVRWLSSSPVRPASVAGFPDGSSATGTKLYEGRDLLRRGAREIDLYLNAGKLRSRQFQHVEMEVLQLAQSCLEAGAQLRVVIPNELLEDDLKIIATKIARRCDAHFVAIAALEADCTLLRPVLKERLALKALRVTTLDGALAAQRSGCTRIETANTAAILDEWRRVVTELQQGQQAPPASIS